MTEKRETQYSEEYIDLKAIILAIWTKKWTIVGITILCALIGFLTRTFFMQANYEATAYLGISQPSIDVNLEPSINIQSPLEDYRQLLDITQGLPEMSQTEDVWLVVCEELDLTCLSRDNNKPDLEASLIGASQLKLQVTSKNPDLTVEFANLWAKEIITRWNLIYGIGENDLLELELEVEQAHEEWNIAQTALEEYLPQSQISVVQVQLRQAEDKLYEYLDEIESIQRIIRDANSMDRRLKNLDQENELQLGDALSLVGLLERTTGNVSSTQFQVTNSEIFGAEFQIIDARQTIIDFVSALEDHNVGLSGQLNALEEEITQLTLEKELEQSKIDQLELERDRAQTNYRILSRYLDESQIAEQFTRQAAFIVAKAIIPLRKESNLLVITSLAGIIGLMVSVGGVLIKNWWDTE